MADRKKIKAEYKQNPPPMGVYQIRNKANGKIFIGSAQNVTGKLNSQMFQLRTGVHKNRELQNDFNEAGPDNFEFTILDHLESVDDPVKDPSKDLADLEALWLEKLQPFGQKGYLKQKA